MEKGNQFYNKLNKIVKYLGIKVQKQKNCIYFCDCLTASKLNFSFKVMKGLKSKDKKLFENTKKVHLIATSVWAYREKRAGA